MISSANFAIPVPAVGDEPSVLLSAKIWYTKAEAGYGGQEATVTVSVPMPGVLQCWSVTLRKICVPSCAPSGSAVVLEFLPYRKDDWTSRRDELRHTYFASRGYIACRVDMRGSGASEGYMLHPFAMASRRKRRERYV